MIKNIFIRHIFIKNSLGYIRVSTFVPVKGSVEKFRLHSKNNHNHYKKKKYFLFFDNRLAHSFSLKKPERFHKTAAPPYPTTRPKSPLASPELVYLIILPFSAPKSRAA